MTVEVKAYCFYAGTHAMGAFCVARSSGRGNSAENNTGENLNFV
jgi:hypothetical protein